MIDDGELVRRVLSGDADAYRTVVERHQARILYMGLKFFRRREDAEDFAQEVFLRAYEKLSLYGGTGSFAAWLYRLAYRLAVNGWHGARAAMEADVLDEETVAAGDRSVEEALESGEAAHWVEEAVKGLPARYALILRMRYYDGLGYGEIAEILDMPLNTVKSHVFRAKEIIRSRLARRMEA